MNHRPGDNFGFRRPAHIPRLAATQRLAARGLAILAGTVFLAAGLGAAGARSDENDRIYLGTFEFSGMGDLEAALDSTKIELAEAQAELERARSLIDYSARFNIPANLAALIYDTAEKEGVDPEVGFRLVYVESRFNPRARSTAGALGLAQVLPTTARFFVPGITETELYDPETNLRIGFRYLHELLDAFEDDLPLALIAYNRGPSRLRELLAGGQEPWNGYASSVLDGYEHVSRAGLQ